MALAPGEARKDLSADALFGSLRSRFASLPDPRSGEVEIPLADALMSAFAMFSLKDPSLLAFDHRRHNPNDNFRTIYGINRNTVRRRNWRSEKLPSLNTWIRYLSQCGGERGLFLLRRTVLSLSSQKPGAAKGRDCAPAIRKTSAV